MLIYMDEEKVRMGIEGVLQPGETLQSIGKAMKKRLGFRYYTGFTDERAVFTTWVGEAPYRSKFIPLSELDGYVEEKGIELLPFEAPFLIKKKSLARYEEFKKMLLGYLEQDEKLISMAWANGGFLHYCLGFTGQRIIVLRITRIGNRMKKLETILLSELKDIRKARIWPLVKGVEIDVPLENRIGMGMIIEFENGRTRRFRTVNSGFISRYNPI